MANLSETINSLPCAKPDPFLWKNYQQRGERNTSREVKEIPAKRGERNTSKERWRNKSKERPMRVSGYSRHSFFEMQPLKRKNEKRLASPNFVFFFVMVFLGFPNQNPKVPLSSLEEWFSKWSGFCGSFCQSTSYIWRLALCPCARAVTLAGFQVRHRVAVPHDGRAVLRLVWVRGRRAHRLCVRVHACVCVDVYQFCPILTR